MKKFLKSMLALSAVLLLGACGTQNQQASEKKKDEEITLYLVRHGKTFFNSTGQVQGFCDSPLTEDGIEKAKQLGEGLKDIEFDLAYSSDLGRQRNTAKLILSKTAKSKPKLTELDGFKEWNYGGYEGKTSEEMITPVLESNGFKYDESGSQFGALIEKLGDEGIINTIAKNDPLKAAESYDEIVARGTAAMDKVIKDAKKNNAKNVLIVSSGSMIPTLLTITAQEEYKGEPISNCSVTTLKYKEGTYSIESIGDTQYIE